MSSELRVNSSTNRSGLGTITYTDSGPIVSGVGTFANGLTVDGTQTTVKSLKFTGDNYNANWFKTSNRLRFNDNARVSLGSADDLSLYHDGSHSYIVNGTNYTYYLSTQHHFKNVANNELQAKFQENEGVTLYYNNSPKFATTETGVTITGTAVAGALDISGDIDVDGHTDLDNVSVAGVSTFSSAVNVKKTSGSALLKLENTNGASYLDIRHTNGYGAVHYVHQGTEKWRVGQTAQADHFSVYQSSSVSDGLPYRFFIQNNGEVGINTSDPANTLHLLRNTNHGITLQKGGTNPGSALIQVSSYGALSLQASNNLTLQSGGSQQIFFNRGSTAVAKFDTSGRLLLGTTTEGHSSADDLTINNSGHGGITIRTGTTSNGAIFFSDATSGAAEYDGFVQYNHDNTNGRLLLGTMGSTTCTVNGQYQSFLVGTTLHRTAEFSHPDGFSIRGDDKGQFQNTVTDVMGGLMNRDGSDGAILGFRREGTSVGHIGVNASTMYLNFGGTNAAAHQLDDYEEGTFSPYYTDGQNTQFSQHSSGFAYGEYVKIGKLVYFTCGVRCSGYDRTPSGRVFLHNLPFVSKNYGDDDEPQFSMQSRLWGSGNPPKLARMQQGTGGTGRNRIALGMDAHLATNESYLEGSDFDTSATCRVVISGHYMVP